MVVEAAAVLSDHRVGMVVITVSPFWGTRLPFPEDQEAREEIPEAVQCLEVREGQVVHRMAQAVPMERILCKEPAVVQEVHRMEEPVAIQLMQAVEEEVEVQT